MSVAPASTRLVARTEEVGDPGALFALLPATGQLSWVKAGEGMVAWGHAARIETSGPERFAQARTAWERLVAEAEIHDEVGLLGCGPIAFGSFAFAADSEAGGVLVVPSHVVGTRRGRWWHTTISCDDGTPPAPAGGPVDRLEESSPFGAVRLEDGALDAAAWKGAVARALEVVAAGGVQKVVLARDVVATTERPVTLPALLGRLHEAYPACWTFAVDGLVGATPELLVRREGERVTSRVLAGTIPRDPTGRGPETELAAALSRSEKDLHEHEYAVRSVVDVLGRSGHGFDVHGPYVLSLANVLHLATDVTGSLDDGATSLALAEALHPSAAVCGTPTQAAGRLIEEIEHMDRDRYAGPVGWIDAAGNGEWAIALRCGRVDPQDPRRMRLFAGCGVVAGSDPDTELAESVAKLRPMRTALGAS